MIVTTDSPVASVLFCKFVAEIKVTKSGRDKEKSRKKAGKKHSEGSSLASIFDAVFGSIPVIFLCNEFAEQDTKVSQCMVSRSFVAVYRTAKAPRDRSFRHAGGIGSRTLPQPGCPIIIDQDPALFALFPRIA
jgi:hypothetical protein